MFYETTTSSGLNCIIQADSSRQAKVKACKEHGFKPSDKWTGACSMHAHKLAVDYPETVFYPSFTEEALQPFVDKDVILYDEHHGTSVRIRKATVESIQYFLDEYSTVILL